MDRHGDGDPIHKPQMEVRAIKMGTMGRHRG